MRPQYLFHQAMLLAIVAYSTAHISRTVYGHVVSDRSLSRHKRKVIRNYVPLRIPRGGGELSQVEKEEHDPVAMHALNESKQPPTVTPKERKTAEEATLWNMGSAIPPTRKKRHTSDIITNMMDKGLDNESYELRELIASRAQSYMNDLLHSSEKLPHPKRTLHYLAPKIPAIKHSPDLMLRVQSSRGGIDAGVAACTIGTVARLCERYDRQNLQETDDAASVSIGSDIVKDRRFQQLVECVLCGVDVRKRREETERKKVDEEVEEAGELRDIEEVLDEEDIKIDEGLSVQDACRAAWGIAILGGFHTESFSEVATEDILTALSLRSRELLLARLQLLRQGDTQKQAEDGTLIERLDQDADELAEDAASAMWVFACVKACTGIRSIPLFEACCSILCQNPDELRERAQAAKEGLDGSNFEANDVLERLARSEIDDSLNETAIQAISTTTCETRDVLKDALLDWLTPNEVTDVLWALALHGSPIDSDSKEETALSETAAAFREIAFDRLVTGLHRDMDIIEQVKRNGMDSPLLRPEIIKTEEGYWSDGLDAARNTEGGSQGEKLVEVVDASTLLASSALTETQVVKTIDNISVKDDHEGVTKGQLQMETEVHMASTVASPYETTMQSVQTMETGEPSAHSEISIVSQNAPFPPDSRMSALLRSGKLSFSSHDLCSIAWVVTDLRDPLRSLIVDLITRIFASFGKESLTGLPMGDLSNLVWGMARSATQNRGMSWTEYSETPSATVTQWTTECALTKLRLDGDFLKENDTKSAVRCMLKEFQPPELGRLMWSLCFSVAANLDPFAQNKERDVASSRLAMLALLTAGSNLSIFSTEDLARICWAFLELCDPKEALSQPLMAESLGRALSAVESSLLLWESGPRTRSTLRNARGQVEDSFHYSTFFGRRFPLPLLNHGVNEHEDEEDENLSYQTERKLPLLRDLPVDPSSLCKLASGFSSLNQNQPSIVGGWTFLRVAIRLLASKNGQLMEQCPVQDVIRLCHACAMRKTNGREREQVLHLYARRVVQFMNEALDPDRNAHGKAADRLAHAAPWEISILMWSLGELGARHFTTDENRRLAHRKLHLVTDRPLLTEEQLQSLSAASTANLLHGIVAMDMVSSVPSFVSTVLHDFEAKVGALRSGKELTDLAETIAKLRRSIWSKKSLDIRGDHTADDTETGRKEDEIDTILGKPMHEHNSTTDATAILEVTNRLLAGVAEKAIEKVHELSGTEMRKLLLVFLLVPFQCDSLVDAIEEETNQRMALLGFSSNKELIEDLAKRAADSALQASNSLLARPSTVGSTIKNGIKAIFGVHDSDEISEEDAAILSKVADSIDRTSTLIRDISERMERVQRGTGLGVETLLSGVEQGAAVELGRCQELIEWYHRIDFSTGSHGGRCDNERRKDIGKRLLSRFFP